MTTCARCGLPNADDAFPSASLAATHCRVRVTAGTGLADEAIIDCRDRQIAAQAALLRSVTGKLEMLLTRLDDLSEPCSIREDLDSLLEKLS